MKGPGPLLAIKYEWFGTFGLDAAVVLAYLIQLSYYRKKIDGGYFRLSHTRMAEDFPKLTTSQQNRILNRLKNLGAIRITRKGFPSRRYVRIEETEVWKT